MEKINFINNVTKCSAETFNTMQDNIEDAINDNTSSINILSNTIDSLNNYANTYIYSSNVNGDNACTSGWVDTLQKSYTFTNLTPNKTYLIIWSCSWVRNNETEGSATSGECKWKTNNGGFTNGVMTAPSGVNQTFTCFGYGVSDASGNLTVNLYSNSGGAWASKTPYFSGLNVLVFGI